jgi:hypothetical protein
LVTDWGQDTNTGGRPSRLYMHWSYTWGHNRPQGFAPNIAPTIDQNDNSVVEGFAPHAPNAPQTSEAAVFWQTFEPGTRIELNLTDGTWEEGWIVKSCNKTTGEHEAWKYPDLSRTKCKLRAGIEMRETVVIDYEEAL